MCSMIFRLLFFRPRFIVLNKCTLLGHKIRAVHYLHERGEFVDMTLAADGHHVKVHQILLSLASQFIKDLLISANCPHPIIFLNRVSYKTLVAILEYVYTGEVVVRKDKMGEFLEASKDLQIRGLDHLLNNPKAVDSLFEEANSRKRKKSVHGEETKQKIDTCEPIPIDDDDFLQPEVFDDERFDAQTNVKEKNEHSVNLDSTKNRKIMNKMGPPQYSVSIFGNLQIVLNRYLYSFIHVRKNDQRYWRCVNQQKTGCLAYVATSNEKIVERGHPHNHPFHDAQILKKIKNGNMFTSVNEVEDAAKVTKSKRSEADILKALNTSETD